MSFTIREINKKSSFELEIVTKRCMITVLETIPDFAGSEEAARSSLSNFSLAQMSQMIEKDFFDPSKRIMVAEENNLIVGQGLFSIKVDNEGGKFGFFFNRYVVPEYRERGIASALLKYALNWFVENEASYAIAQTHLTNLKLQQLFAKFGFQKTGPHQGPAWQYYLLKKEF